MLTNMLRVRWFNNHSESVLSLLYFLFLIPIVFSECWYNDETYEEGMEVITTEPCLNCTCTKGVLLCYLRVCPTLPNPPPVGCILLHKFKTCCPELICTVRTRWTPKQLLFGKSSSGFNRRSIFSRYKISSTKSSLCYKW